jgi:hypothetical protein
LGSEVGLVVVDGLDRARVKLLIVFTDEALIGEPPERSRLIDRKQMISLGTGVEIIQIVAVRGLVLVDEGLGGASLLCRSKNLFEVVEHRVAGAAFDLHGHRLLAAVRAAHRGDI